MTNSLDTGTGQASTRQPIDNSGIDVPPVQPPLSIVHSFTYPWLEKHALDSRSFEHNNTEFGTCSTVDDIKTFFVLPGRKKCL